MAKHRLLFVCLGNICRSPMAEGVFRRVIEEEGVADRFEIDSAGMGDWHIGQAPDTRAQAAAQNRGMDISGQRARQVTAADYRRFDLILAMDDSNYDELIGLAPKSELHKVRLFLDYAPQAGTRRCARSLLWRERRLRSCARSDRGRRARPSRRAARRRRRSQRKREPSPRADRRPRPHRVRRRPNCARSRARSGSR